jgi:hypothetical protein
LPATTPTVYISTKPSPSALPEFHLAKVSAALLRGELDIANALISQATLEFAIEELTEWIVTTLKDTGADISMANEPLVAEIESRGLASRFPLRTPIHLGSVANPHAMTITHAISLPLREGNRFYYHTFGVAPIPSPPHLIMGQPWFREHCPEALEIINRFGFHDIHTQAACAQAMAQHGLLTPITTPGLTPTSSPPCSPPDSPALKPLALPPCKDPQTAFLAGGGNPLLAAIESEEHCRHEALEKHRACISVRIAIDRQLEEHAHTAYVRASATSGSADPGVRGLTGNKEGWLDTIPPEYRHLADTLFSDEAASELPPYRQGADCVINIREGQKLRASKLYDMSQEELKQLKSLLDLELERGFIRPSKSESSAPVFFVRDPSSGTRSGQLRLVIDYRDLNSKIELDEYPIPLTRTVMNDLAGADWITSMDVRSGFANLRVAPGSEKATAFKTFYGLFEYTVMPMGLATAPSIFQRFINSVLNPYLGIFCHAYLDDVVIYTKGTLEEHKAQVLKVLEALAENGLRLKPHKCKWFRKECDFLGFTVVVGKGVRMAEDKIQAIRDMEPPRNLGELRHFLGVAGFYDKFIPHYSDVTACLTALTRKDAAWNFDERCLSAFETIRNAIRDDVFLRAFDPTKPTRLSTDSSDEAYAGVMEQEYDGVWMPFLLFHHKFQAAEKNWDIHDKELYAIVHAFTKYRHFLAQTSSPVQVFTDHRNLSKFMFSTNLLKSHDGRLGRWWEILSQCNFEIQYLPGADNLLADFFSRYGFQASSELPERTLLPASRFSSKALADIKTWFKKSTDPNIRKLLETRFAEKSENQNSSPDPVPETTTAPVPGRPMDILINLKTPLQEGIQDLGALDDVELATYHGPSIRSALTAARSRLVPSSLTPRQAALAASCGLDRYAGCQLDILTKVSTNHRTTGDRRGLGAP